MKCNGEIPFQDIDNKKVSAIVINEVYILNITLTVSFR